MYKAVLRNNSRRGQFGGSGLQPGAESGMPYQRGLHSVGLLLGQGSQASSGTSRHERSDGDPCAVAVVRLEGRADRDAAWTDVADGIPAIGERER
jgi:hypothetical protein